MALNVVVHNIIFHIHNFSHTSNKTVVMYNRVFGVILLLVGSGVRVEQSTIYSHDKCNTFSQTLRNYCKYSKFNPTPVLNEWFYGRTVICVTLKTAEMDELEQRLGVGIDPAQLSSATETTPSEAPSVEPLAARGQQGQQLG